MKTRLNQLTMAAFIELHCGDCSVILENGENIPEEDLKKKATDLLFEYRNIVDPVGVKNNTVGTRRETQGKHKSSILPSLQKVGIHQCH